MRVPEWIEGKIYKNEHKVKACITKSTITVKEVDLTTYEISFSTIINQRLFELRLVGHIDQQKVIDEMFTEIADSFVRTGPR